MAKGLIEKQDKTGFEMVKKHMFSKWDNFRGENSLNAYTDAGYSITRFLWDTFHTTKLKIGDGVGTQGDVLWYKNNLNDEHITTAFKSIWVLYLKHKEAERAERMKNPI